MNTLSGSDRDVQVTMITVITVNNIITYCLVKTEYDVTSSIIALIICMCVSLVPGMDQTGEI